VRIERNAVDLDKISWRAARRGEGQSSAYQHQQAARAREAACRLLQDKRHDASAQGNSRGILEK